MDIKTQVTKLEARYQTAREKKKKAVITSTIVDGSLRTKRIILILKGKGYRVSLLREFNNTIVLKIS